MGKTIVLSGGGTAGHINPALALAEVLQERGCTVHYAGTPDHLESRLVPAAGLPYKAFQAGGFDRAHPATLVSGVRKIMKSTKLAKRWFSDIRPDCVVGFGGYVCIPVSRAAEQLGIPVVLHEQNSVMGMANRYLAKRAAAVCLTYADTLGSDAPAGRTHVTGNPVRAAVMAATRQQGLTLYGIPDDARVLLAFGGSLGARHINQAIAGMKDQLLGRPDAHVIQITGPKELEAVEEALALTDEERRRWHLLGYQDRMAETLACADCIVSRAGATSLAEISARCIPAVLVPYPHATEDHQTKNAAGYVAAGAALMVPDSDLDAPAFADAVLRLLDDADERARMRRAAEGLEAADAAAKLADVVLGCAR